MAFSSSLKVIATTAALWQTTGACGSSSWDSRYPDAQHQSVDVIIIGGGSSGSNEAIHILDSGHSVLVVEKQAQLGGMVNSWTDPDTDKTYDFGVAAITNYTGVVEYFERLGINITTPSFATTTSYYADFTTGETIDYVAPDTTTEFAAMGAYYNVSSSYADLFVPSYANWPAPEDIPEDLLMPFGEFAVKYDLNATMLLMWTGIAAGLADMVNAPTLYVMQTFGPDTAGAFLGLNGQYIPSSGRNQDIYDAVASILGDSVMLNSVAVATNRLADDQGVSVVVQNTITDNYTIVSAKRLIISLEPTAENLAVFDLDATEAAVFDDSSLRWSVVQTGIITHPSLPVDGMIYNLPVAAASGDDFAFPEPPFVDYIQYIGPGLWQAIAVGWENFTTAEAQELTNEAVQALAAAGTIPATNGTDVTIKTWSNHGPMDMRTTAENLQAGFIQKLYALQGYRSTFWTGAAFANQLSNYLWAYNLEYLNPLVLSSLESSD